MEWTPDKVAHYRKSFNWSRTGLILGFVPILAFTLAGRFSLWLILFLLSGAFLILCLGAAKEIIYDKWMGKGQAEWLDMKANLIGAWDGLTRIKKRH
jgi:uncharacterized iron-regulated membrane protein